ncbi:hypothetical protein [Thiogranum longum]|jgi:hypothetical protein
MTLKELTKDPAIDEDAEDVRPETAARGNRSNPLYIRKSITRLSVIADRPLKNKSDICAALEDYGHCLPAEQRQALQKWCDLG